MEGYISPSQERAAPNKRRFTTSAAHTLHNRISSRSGLALRPSLLKHVRVFGRILRFGTKGIQVKGPSREIHPLGSHRKPPLPLCINSCCASCARLCSRHTRLTWSSGILPSLPWMPPANRSSVPKLGTETPAWALEQTRVLEELGKSLVVTAAAAVAEFSKTPGHASKKSLMVHGPAPARGPSPRPARGPDRRHWSPRLPKRRRDAPEDAAARGSRRGLLRSPHPTQPSLEHSWAACAKYTRRPGTPHPTRAAALRWCQQPGIIKKAQAAAPAQGAAFSRCLCL